MGLAGKRAAADDILTCRCVCGFVEWQLASNDRATASGDIFMTTTTGLCFRNVELNPAGVCI